jgi:KpsF/GutQ family protein
VKKAESLWKTAVQVWKIASAELTRLESSVDRNALLACIDALRRCRGRIITTGVGTSAAAARKIAHSLSCIEQPAFFLSPADAVHGAMGSAQKGDTAILISKGGGTREVVNLIPALRFKGVFVIGVTENPDSPLAKKCDLLLNVKVEREADPFNMLATTSTMAVVAVFDAVCIALMEATGYTREQFALIHPGGAVGERLLKGKD